MNPSATGTDGVPPPLIAAMTEAAGGRILSLESLVGFSDALMGKDTLHRYPRHRQPKPFDRGASGIPLSSVHSPPYVGVLGPQKARCSPGKTTGKGLSYGSA